MIAKFKLNEESPDRIMIKDNLNGTDTGMEYVFDHGAVMVFRTKFSDGIGPIYNCKKGEWFGISAGCDFGDFRIRPLKEPEDALNFKLWSLGYYKKYCRLSVDNIVVSNSRSISPIMIIASTDGQASFSYEVTTGYHGGVENSRLIPLGYFAMADTNPSVIDDINNIKNDIEKSCFVKVDGYTVTSGYSTSIFYDEAFHTETLTFAVPTEAKKRTSYAISDTLSYMIDSDNIRVYNHDGCCACVAIESVHVPSNTKLSLLDKQFYYEVSLTFDRASGKLII